MGERRISKLSPKGKAKVLIVGVLAAVFVFVYILSSVGVIPLSALLLKATVAVSGNDDRFPILIDTESTICSDIIGDSVILLTADNLVVYSPEGKLEFSQPHVFSKPGLSVNGDCRVCRKCKCHCKHNKCYKSKQHSAICGLQHMKFLPKNTFLQIHQVSTSQKIFWDNI